jgi:acyl-CoA reductase-like NAD-dependent aldehyde dehydrogenase
MKTYFPYVAGEFVETKEFIDVTEKFNGNVFARAGIANGTLLGKSISEAKTAEKKLAEMSSGARSRILMQIAEQLMTEKHWFAEILAMEAGKPLRYALVETERAAQTFQTAAEEAKRIHSELLPLDWFSHGENKEALIKLFPVGVVSGITPFNFPLNLVAHKVAPAIAARCPIILKPASATPLSSLELARIIDQTDLPAGAFSVLPMSHSVSRPLINDVRIKKISFTGSPEVGWQMKQDCGRKKITLELGGNAAAIVTESANMDEAAGKCVTGAFAFSGQVCIHTQRIFVQREMFDGFLKAFLQKTASLKYGNPLDIATDISVMIDESNALRVENWIQEALLQGATLLAGGKRSGCFIEPTVLTGANPEMKVWKDEVFGPVVIIEPYDGFSHAIEMVNASVFGLQAGVFTNHIDEMNIAYRDIETGAVLINESPTYRIDHMPYGGIKESGFGREGLKYAINEMCEMKVLLKPV